MKTTNELHVKYPRTDGKNTFAEVRVTASINVEFTCTLPVTQVTAEEGYLSENELREAFEERFGECPEDVILGCIDPTEPYSAESIEVTIEDTDIEDSWHYTACI